MLIQQFINLPISIDFFKFNGQNSMQDVLMVGKNSCNVSKLVVRALHSNFAMDNLENGTYC